MPYFRPLRAAAHAPAGSGNAALGGYKAWVADPIALTGATAITAGRLIVARMIVESPGTATTLYVPVSTGASGNTAGQCGAAIYDAAGQTLASVGDYGTALNTLGLIGLTFPSVNLTAGQVIYSGLLFNGTTGPTLLRGGINVATSGVGSGLAANQRWGKITGLTAVPSSINPAGLASSDGPFWFAVA